jgi:hypothetical protein
MEGDGGVAARKLRRRKEAKNVERGQNQGALAK